MLIGWEDALSDEDFFTDRDVGTTSDAIGRLSHRWF